MEVRFSGSWRMYIRNGSLQHRTSKVPEGSPQQTALLPTLRTMGGRIILRVITSVELRNLTLLLFLPTRRLEIQLCLSKALEYL
jgi:hypothetical protein